MKDVKSIMHYGGQGFYATNKKTKQRIEQNTVLSPLDIEKLNYYYPPICKPMKRCTLALKR